MNVEKNYKKKKKNAKKPTFLPISSGRFFDLRHTTFTGFISAQQIYSNAEKQVKLFTSFFTLECDRLDVEVYNP